MELYRVTSVAWSQAALADGVSEEEAVEAAERARAFYSGEEAEPPTES